MITVYQLPPAFGLPVSVSPYCTKLEAYMRLTNREFRTAVADLRKSPNKKVPYVDGLGQGGLMAESGNIIAELEQLGPSLDGGLSAEDEVLGKELEDLAQRDLYFGCLHSRFAEPGGWEHQKPTVKALVPWVLSPLLVPVIRRSQVKLCAENGFADPSGYDGALKVVERIAEVLGDKPFLLGDAPRVADCSVWANLTHTAYTLASNPPREAVRANGPIMAYVQRLADRLQLKLPPLR